MENRYRIIIAGKTIYKEIEVEPDDTLIRFGTENSCEVRIRRDLFYNPVELTFSKDEKGIWNIMCSDTLYISVDEVRKLMTLPLRYGEEIVVRHQESNSEAFHITFLIDFDHEEKKYDCRFDISSLSEVQIGEQPDNHIMIRGNYIRNDKIVLRRQQNNTLLLDVISTQYGVYQNGSLVQGRTVICEGDFFSIANISFCYRGYWLFTQRSENIVGNGIKALNSTDRGDYPKFRRNSRIKTIFDDTKIEVLDPPSIPQKPKNNLLTRLLPSLGMILSSLVIGMAGSVFVLVSLVSAVVGIVTAVSGIKKANKEYKEELANRIDKYNAYITNKRGEISRARAEEMDALKRKYVSEQEEMGALRQFSYKLFDRRAEDEDFMEVRLGIGKCESVRKVDYKKQERLEIEDELQLRPKELAEQYKFLDNAPIVCDFKQADAVGIIGQADSRYSILKNMLVDICARQYLSDVKMFFVAENRHASLVQPFKMLPQVYNDVLGVHNIVCDDSSRTVIFEYLYKELTLRGQEKIKMPHLLIFLYDEYGFKSHPVSRFVDNAKELGVTFVFFGETRADIGQGCRFLIEMMSNTQGVLMDTEDDRKKTSFVFQGISDGDIASMIQLLAPVYTEEISLEGSLTKNISLFELLNIFVADDIDLGKRWVDSKVYRSIAAPIGVSKSGVIELDLHDKAHGPHGLVAGTTGAGKSELLQTYILSMATLYHPYEVGFVIIDFKGGGMADQFAQLPHMLGTITNIDGREIERSLRSIKAELNKRQQFFRAAGVNHIDKYIAKFRKGEVKIPMPHLILIVDEFAELKADQPEFMKELISAARIGRSLGVHLILATQKPSGQVDDQIWSNSRFKLCLKVQSSQDSNEVLKSPLAAEIKEPGRAYLQVGNNEIFELFQSAYSGAPEHVDDSAAKEFVIYEIKDSARRVPVYVQKKDKENIKSSTQLDAIVKYIHQFCAEHSVEKLPDICLPSLEKRIVFPKTDSFKRQESDIIAELGIYDDPDRQQQNVYSLNLTNQNVMVIGSTQTGKTNLLQSIVRVVAEKYSSKEVNLYVLDFGSMVFKNYEDLHHIGGVVYAHEEEKCKNLFKMLNQEIAKRKEIFAESGVSSFSTYREAGFDDLPQIVLMVDNLTVMRELYLMDDDFLLPVCRDGLSVGISVVIANSQTSGIGYRYLANFDRRIAFCCNDTTEYGVVFDNCRMKPLATPGRCLISIDKTIYEMQTYLAFDGEKEIDRVRNISAFVREINDKNPAYSARKIPAIPAVLSEKILYEEYGAAADRNRMPLGLDFSDVEPVVIDWLKQGVLMISGRLEKTKRQFMEYLKKQLGEMEAGVYILDDYSGVFEQMSANSNVRLYSRSAEDIGEMLEEVKQIMAERYAERDMKGNEAVDGMSPVIFLIQNQDAIEKISNDSNLMEAYREILSRYKGLKCCFFFTNVENETIGYNSPEILKMTRDNNQFLVFEELGNIKLFDYSSALLRKYHNVLDEGEGYLASGNELTKIKIVGLLNRDQHERR